MWKQEFLTPNLMNTRYSEWCESSYPTKRQHGCKFGRTWCWLSSCAACEMSCPVQRYTVYQNFGKHYSWNSNANIHMKCRGLEIVDGLYPHPSRPVLLKLEPQIQDNWDHNRVANEKQQKKRLQATQILSLPHILHYAATVTASTWMSGGT